MILITETWPGNVHATAIAMNKLDLADFVHSIEYSGGSDYSTLILKVPAKHVEMVRRVLDKDRYYTPEGLAEANAFAGNRSDHDSEF